MSDLGAQGVNRVLVVGGGTAGWITACLLAAEHPADELQICLVESPDIPTIGVGEGTWPSMRQTLARIGISEDNFLVKCDASFKQGTCFAGWADGDQHNTYLHPFSLPIEYTALNPARAWLTHGASQPFADFVSPQPAVIGQGLAPKTLATPDYAFAVNYGYHLDAGKFVDLLRTHGTQKLGVQLVTANMTDIQTDADGYVDRIDLDDHQSLQADVFIDCTGHRGLLINELDEFGFVSLKDSLFNDAAVAVQVPYKDQQAAIASTTTATAQASGWIWDIGLRHRRGLGCVFSKSHMTQDEAHSSLERYIDAQPQFADCEQNALNFRTLHFEPGHRGQFWVKNCVAVGLSAGFVEPLEASAIALIEQSASAISQDLPKDRVVMRVVAKRFNDKMNYHWQKIAEFLKLHYAISKRRDSQYWRDHTDPATWSEGLRDKLLLWQQQTPFHDDAPWMQELFPSASYQFVLYGMGFSPRQHQSLDKLALNALDVALHKMSATRDNLLQNLPTNRALLAEIEARCGAI